ncbi:hypothetical protein GOBAR_DD03102 [Gossypium barbadense]|nr:hypothetical protein GOBAR_DD03102 [Gossypium barbadense]
MRVGYTIFILFVSLSLLGFLNGCNAHRLRYNFYKVTCPQANQIVKRIITNETRTNPALGAQLIRMQFHDCFVRGCDGSVLLDTVNNGSKAEKDAIPNRSLKGFDVIDDIKNAIEKVCPNVVSCADILALAARDAVSAPFKRRLWNVALGRRDGRISLASAHTIGVAHCGTFSRRLYNFTGKGDADPTLDPTYADFLRKQCPNPANPKTIVEMDPGSSRSFDKHYYHILRQNKGLFISDAALLTNKESESIVIRLQRSRGLFFAAFARSMRKMAAIDVLTGKDGEIRRNCRVVNP